MADEGRKHMNGRYVGGFSLQRKQDAVAAYRNLELRRPVDLNDAGSLPAQGAAGSRIFLSNCIGRLFAARAFTNARS